MGMYRRQIEAESSDVRQLRREQVVFIKCFRDGRGERGLRAAAAQAFLCFVFSSTGNAIRPSYVSSISE